jgi:hypothetical protein
MDDDLGRIWKEAVMVYLKNYLGIYLEELRKTMKDRLGLPLSRPRIESSSEYESGTLPLIQSVRYDVM